MATYVISDIHGALDEFRTLLKKISFQYDGTDELYLLGDYCDWGLKSLETLLYVKELDETYPFVHTLMGNHELMFLTTILSGYKDGDEDVNAKNWLYANKGLATWKAYLQLPEEDKGALAIWMHGLPLSATVKVEGRTYLLSHAYPYFYDQIENEEEGLQKRVDALWRRLMLHEDPFADYHGEENYTTFICGHTITDYYYGLVRFERDWPYWKPTDYMRNHIFRGERFIDIDCGAKCMDYDYDSRELIQMAALRAQLAALSLEDEKEYYVHRPPIHIPEANLPNLPNIQDLAVGQSFLEISKWLGVPGRLSGEELQKILNRAGISLFRGEKKDTINNYDKETDEES